MILALLTLFINILSIGFVIKILTKELKNRNSIILYYCFICLYIVLIPLLYDSVSYLIEGRNNLTTKLLKYNETETRAADYRFLTLTIICEASIYVFLFNLLLIGSYKMIIRKKKMFYIPLKKEYFMPNYYYLICGIICVSIFLYYYGFDVQRIGVEYRKTILGNTNPFLSFLMHFCMISLISVVLKGLVSKTYFVSFFLLLPVLLIGILTIARALIISIPFMILYYIIASNYNKNIFKVLLTTVLIGVAFIFIMLQVRGADASYYPIERDISVYDLYYGIANREHINIFSKGYHFLYLIKIGLPFIPWPPNYEPLEAILANYRIYDDWGTLHPTLFGWAYIDSGWAGLLIAIFFGLFIGITDKVRNSLPIKLSYLFLPFQMAFVAVLIRGSVQYAYANIIYVLFFFITYLFVKKIILRKIKYKNK